MERWPRNSGRDYQRLHRYTLVTPPTNENFETLFFNFHNPVLASHPEVRQAIATAINYQADNILHPTPNELLAVASRASQ